MVIQTEDAPMALFLQSCIYLPLSDSSVGLLFTKSSSLTELTSPVFTNLFMASSMQSTYALILHLMRGVQSSLPIKKRAVLQMPFWNTVLSSLTSVYWLWMECWNGLFNKQPLIVKSFALVKDHYTVSTKTSLVCCFRWWWSYKTGPL